MTEAEAAAAKYAYDLQSVWSQTADKLKAGPTRQRILRLYLTTGAAVLALAASQVKSVSGPASVGLAIVAAIVLAAVAFTRYKATPEQAKHWTQARSVSEALKAEVFLFLCRGGEYRSDDRVRLLWARVRGLERDAAKISGHKLGITAKDRQLPDVTDLESYLTERVRKSQLEGYYRKKADETKGRLDWLKVVEIILALVAAGLAAVAISSSSVAATIAAWAAVATTASGALAAYVAAQRYEFLWIEYSRTADQLQQLLDRHASGDPTAPNGAELAAECERVISIQNEAWMAKWGEPDDSAASADAT